MDERRDPEEPELEGYVPTERPVRGRHMQRAMRITVLLGIAALVLPGILITLGFAQRTADAACRAYVAVYAAGSKVHAPFELVAADGPGWQCYAVGTSGSSRHIASLGLLPTPPQGRDPGTLPS